VNVFFDTNVVLDVFRHRQPFYEFSAKAWGLAERGKFQGVVSAVCMTTLYYVVRKLRSRGEAGEMLQAVRGCVGFALCDTTVLNQAIDAGFADFEDAVQYYSAIAAGADVLLTRNKTHFPTDELPIMSPKAFLAAHSFN
jgi:predicted nucleic acid-binding protein